MKTGKFDAELCHVHLEKDPWINVCEDEEPLKFKNIVIETRIQQDRDHYRSKRLQNKRCRMRTNFDE